MRPKGSEGGERDNNARAIELAGAGRVEWSSRTALPHRPRPCCCADDSVASSRVDAPRPYGQAADFGPGYRAGATLVIGASTARLLLNRVLDVYQRTLVGFPKVRRQWRRYVRRSSRQHPAGSIWVSSELGIGGLPCAAGAGN